MVFFKIIRQICLMPACRASGWQASKLFIIFFLFIACTNQPVQESVDKADAITTKENAVFQTILDNAKVEGTILIYDEQQDIYYTNSFDQIDSGRLPASTFKIPNSIIALETGVVADESTLFKWDGEPRRMAIWEKDMIFKEAFHRSCVPCYQDIARQVGTSRMTAYLKKLDYGNIVVDSSDIDRFWLVGESKVSPMEQIDFLKRLYYKELPITDRTYEIMKQMMVIEDTEDYTISGKTGWSIQNGINNGWYVGYIEQEENVYFFATNISPLPDFDMDRFAMIRSEVTIRALMMMKIIN